MPLEVFKACVDGYSDRLFDAQILGVHQGYWAGYYSRVKRPKQLKDIIKTLFKNHKTIESKKPGILYPDIDVEAFMETERQFNQRKQQLNIYNKE